MMINQFGGFDGFDGSKSTWSMDGSPAPIEQFAATIQGGPLYGCVVRGDGVILSTKGFYGNECWPAKQGLIAVGDSIRVDFFIGNNMGWRLLRQDYVQPNRTGRDNIDPQSLPCSPGPSAEDRAWQNWDAAYERSHDRLVGPYAPLA